MSRSLNKVMLIGNVGKDPDVNYTSSGVPVAQFRLATTESRKDAKGQYHEHTEWHTIIAWRGLAEIIQRLVHRGSRIYIEGRLQTRIFEDQAGTKKYFTEVIAENMLLLDGKRVDENATTVAVERDTQESQAGSSAGTSEESIPF